MQNKHQKRRGQRWKNQSNRRRRPRNRSQTARLDSKIGSSTRTTRWQQLLHSSEHNHGHASGETPKPDKTGQRRRSLLLDDEQTKSPTTPENSSPTRSKTPGHRILREQSYTHDHALPPQQEKKIQKIENLDLLHAATPKADFTASIPKNQPRLDTTTPPSLTEGHPPRQRLLRSCSASSSTGPETYQRLGWTSEETREEKRKRKDASAAEGHRKKDRDLGEYREKKF